MVNEAKIIYDAKVQPYSGCEANAAAEAQHYPIKFRIAIGFSFSKFDPHCINC